MLDKCTKNTKSVSARTDRALNRIRGARSQVLTLSGEKMGFEGTLDGFKRRGEPGMSGREFQISGAATLNVLEPMLVLTCGCAKSCCLCERNAREGLYGCIELAK